MNIEELVAELVEKDVNLWLENGKLKFRAPKAGLPEQLRQKIVAQRDGVVAFLSQQDQGKADAALRPLGRDKPLPLSFEQERLWFLHQLYDELALFNMIHAFEWHGSVNAAALETAIRQVIQRHEILRTRIEVIDGKPFQVPLAEPSWNLNVEVHAGADLLNSQAICQSAYAQEQAHVFDLARGEVMRTRLLCFDTHAVLIFSIDHIASDAWSQQILLSELTQFYAAAVRNVTCTLPGLPVQYADYAVWQRQRLASGKLQASIDFWRNNLNDASFQTRLPIDHPRPLKKTFRGKFVTFALSPETQQRMKSLCVQHSLTFSNVLLSAYALLVSRYTQRSAVSFGIPTAGRERPETQALIGFFVNAVVCRIDTARSKTVAEFMQSVQDTMLQALEHQHVPLECLAEIMNRGRGTSEHLDMPMAFNYVDEGRSAANTVQVGAVHGDEAVPLRPLSLGSTEVAAKHELTLYVSSSSSGVGGWVEYNCDLFSQTSMKQFLVHYEKLLDHMLRSSEQSLQTLSWYDDADVLQWLRAEHPTASRAFALSPVQRDIYFSAQLNLSTRRNNLGCAGHIYRPIDPERWEDAVTKLVSSSDMLRMRLHRFKDSKIRDVYQWVSADTHVDYSFIDWTNGSGPGQQTLEQFIEAFVHRPFDLEQRAPHRQMLIRLSNEHYVTVFAVHHVLFDGRAVQLQAMSLADIYLKGANGLPQHRSADDFQAYAAAARSTMDTPEIIDFWREKIASVEALNVLQPEVDVGLVTLTQRFDTDLWEQVRKYCKRLGITPAMYCKGIYGLLIDYYFQAKSDFLITEFSLGRTEAQLNDFGCYYRQQPFVFAHATAQGNTPFTEFWRHLKDFQRGCKQFSGLSAHAQGQLAPVQSVGFMYNFNGHIKPIEGLYGTQPQDQQGFIPQIEDAVQFYVKNVAEDMQINLVFPSGSLTDHRLLERFMNVTRQLCAGDCQTPLALDFVLPDEARQLLEWESGHAAPANHAVDVLTLFSRQASLHYNRIAVRDLADELTYAALDEQSSALARRLLERHLKPGDKVALLLPRDHRFAVAMLAVTKASACYVPLDPAHPFKRLAYILEDADVAVVVTCDELSHLIDSQHHPMLLWESFSEVLMQASAAEALHLGSPTDPDRDFYVIYTSGTTGNPKGVSVSAGNVASLFHGCSGLFDFGPGDNWSVCHSFAFDFSVWELWGPLITGGCACLVDATTVQDSPLFHDWLRTKKISVLSQTPSAFLALELAGRQRADDPLEQLRYVVFGGEALDIHLLQAWRARYAIGQPVLINMYGITEITVHATFHQITEDDFAANRNTIGKALPHLVAVVLNQGLRRVPPGFAGELFIGGDGVATGYLHRQTLTDERFFCLPQLGHDSVPFYRSGDRARYLPDGSLQYLGRNDRQVKIRGYRIELDEIENVLRSCEGVAGGVVKVVDFGAPIGQRIVAYVCPAPGNLAHLAMQMQARLPHYMVPSDFIGMSQLPLTANGKINYPALPKPDHQAQTEEQVALETPTQIRLAEIMGELLQLRVDSKTANFFALGGHSLLATQLASRIEHHFGLQMPLRTVFKHARLDELASEIDRLSPLGSSERANTVILPRPHDVPPQLSFAQQRLWFLYQVSPRDPFYNLPLVVQFDSLDKAVLEKTILHIISRHEVFRTNFILDEQGKPRVIVNAVPVAWQLETLDLSGLPDGPRRARVQLEIDGNASTAFSLASDLLLRCKLLFLGDKHVLLVATHHIIADGWSLEVLKKEVSELYAAFSANQSSPLLPLPIQYTDFAHWQRQWLSGARLQGHLDYWRLQLVGVEQLDFPTDRARPVEASYRGGYVPLVLTPDVSARLRALAQDHGATPFMVSLAALYVLLARYTGQRDLCLGTPIANRNHSAVEALVGFFVNTLALRVQMDENASFEEFLQVVKRTSLAAYEHQDLPFELLVDHLNIERDTSRNPLFQIMFVLQNVPKNVAASDSAGPIGELLESGRQSSIFDMRVELFDDAEALWGGIEFNVDLFDRSTIQEMAAAYQHLVQQVVDAPARCVLHYGLLDERATRQQVEEFNNTSAALDDAACLHHLVERQSWATPDKTALRFDGRSMTYRQLNDAADRIACRLQALGVGADVPVGVAMDRSLEMVIGLLAILKAGGGYVPIDPDYPANRCRYMVQDSSIRVVLTQPHYRHWDVLTPVETMLVMADGEWLDADAAPSQRPAERPQALADADSLCYVIYTSGSTGRPKGVANVHRALVNRISWMQAQYQLTANDVVLQKTPFSFDVSVWEFFWSLAYGATLVIAKPDGHRDPTYLAALIAHEAITTLHFVPSMLQTFLRLADMSACSSLRRVICSGEALGKSLELQCKTQLVSTELHNLYGPTEAAVDVSYWACDGIDEKRPLPIGRPISNCQLFVLDSRGELLPRGAVGELHIGGVGLARGYWGRPDLTSEKFVHSERLGMRLYKTGDLARHRFDGALEYLGRIDHQVKIRGLRIELGEIESVLTDLDSLSAAAVIVWENKAEEPSQSDKLLVAYVVPAEAASSLTTPDDSDALCLRKVDQWANVFDGIYAADDSAQPEFNISGWNSSYTGKPIDPEQMTHWLNSTVARIRATAGSRMLEVGCGTGLLLFQLARSCSRYVATDISERAVSDIGKYIQNRSDFAHVQVLQAAAETCAELVDESFDTIVLNSVIQYFPSVNYAEKVLNALVNKIPAGGGSVFVGDVRHFGLLRAFHTSVVCFDALPRKAVVSIRRGVEEHVTAETELLLDPAFFHDFCQRHEREIRCDILLKREDCDNEMASYRYDVVLCVAEKCVKALGGSEAELSVLHWKNDVHSVAAFDKFTEDRAYVVCAVPNRRVHKAVELAERLYAVDVGSFQTLGDLQAGLTHNDGPVLGALWRWADHNGWRLEVAWNRYDLRHVDLLLVGPRCVSKRRLSLTAWQFADVVQGGSQVVYANQPMKETLERLVIKQVRDRVERELPVYMVPNQFVVLDKLPLTASGKLDRKALPAPKTANQLAQGVDRYVAPETEFEKQMAKLWCDLLQIDKVSMTADFFALGGHSLLGVELIAKAKKLTGRQVPLINIFNHQTLEAFCRCFNKQGLEAGSTAGFDVAVPLSSQHHPDKLFCIHPGTGDAFSYRVLAAHLQSHHVSVWGIQAPGYETYPDDPVSVQHAVLELEEFLSFTLLAAHYCKVIMQAQPEGPYRVLGWSSGGLLALEISRQLQLGGQTVGFVGMVDSQVPDTARLDYTLNDLAYLQDSSAQALHEHPLRVLLKQLGQGELSSAAQMNHFIRITKYLRKLEGAHLPVMPTGPVHLFIAEDTSAMERGDQLAVGWKSFSDGDLRVHTVPGNHFTVLDSANAGEFTRLLASILHLEFAADQRNEFANQSTVTPPEKFSLLTPETSSETF